MKYAIACIVSLGWLVALMTPAQAYVGPGAGLGAIAATLALFAGLLLLIVGFLWYPLKRLLRRKKPASEARKDT